MFPLWLGLHTTWVKSRPMNLFADSRSVRALLFAGHWQTSARQLKTGTNKTCLKNHLRLACSLTHSHTSAPPSFPLRSDPPTAFLTPSLRVKTTNICTEHITEAQLLQNEHLSLFVWTWPQSRDFLEDRGRGGERGASVVHVRWCDCVSIALWYQNFWKTTSKFEWFFKNLVFPPPFFIAIL